MYDMKIELNIPKLGMWLGLFLIAYLNISAMLWEGLSNSLAVSLIMILVSIIGLSVLFIRTIPTQSIKMALFLYYLYIISVSICNNYLRVYMQEPTMVFSCAFWIFSFLLFWECGMQNSINGELFSKIFFLLTIVCFVLFCRFYSTNLQQEFQLTALNVVYYFLFMLPAVLMSKSKKITGIGIALNIFAVLLSSKRGALIILMVSLFAWMLSDLSGSFTTKKLRKILLYLVVILVSLVAIRSIVDKLDLDIFDRMETFFSGEDEDGSGRTVIWSEYWNHMRQDGLLHNLFGRGYNATKLNPALRDLDISWAHNDFLQIVFDYGIVGFVMFCVIIGKLFKTAFEMKQFQYRYYRQFLVSLYIFLLCCFYSMVTIYPQWFLAMTAFWGIVIGDFERERSYRA